MAEHLVEIFSPPDGLIILVSCHQGSLLNSDGFTPNGVPNTRGVRKTGRFLTNNSLYVGNG